MPSNERYKNLILILLFNFLQICFFHRSSVRHALKTVTGNANTKEAAVLYVVHHVTGYHVGQGAVKISRVATNVLQSVVSFHKSNAMFFVCH